MALLSHMSIRLPSKRTQLEYALVFLFTLALATFWQFHNAFGDPDGFFHVQIAVFLSQGKLITQMPWMQFTTLTQHFTDQHFLYHVALVPFVKLGNPLWGAKVATIMFTTAFFLTFHTLARKLAGRLAPVLTFLLLFSASFTFRLGLIKANSLSLIVLLCLVMAVIKGRWKLVIVLQALYVWLYGGWILGIGVIGLYWLLSIIKVGWKRLCSWKANTAWRLLLASVGGTALGLVANPYWPHNLYFYWQQIIQIGIINYAGRVNVGAEWLPLNFRDIVFFHLYSLTLVLIIAIFSWKQWQRWNLTAWWMLIVALVFFAFTIKSRRYIEFSAPFLLLAAGTLWHQSWPQFSWSGLWRRFATPANNSIITPLYTWTFVVLFTPLIICAFVRDTVNVRSWIAQSGFPMKGLQPEAVWLAQNSQPGDVVFHSDWDLWPMLFYYNQKNYYLVGLDPTFMYNYNTPLYDTWTSITTAQTTDHLGVLIAQSFKSRYVLVTNDAHEFIKALDNDSSFVLAYQGPSARIYKVNYYQHVEALPL